MERLREPWQRLHRDSGGTMFQSFHWNHLAARYFSNREAPYVIFAENDSGAALIPGAVLEGGRLSLLGEHLFDYRDVLATGDEQVLQHAWTRLSELRLPLHFAAVRGARTKGAWASLGMTEFCNAPQVLRAEVSVDEFAAIHRQSPRRLRQLASLGCSLRQRAGHHSQLVRWIYHRKAAQFAHVENSIFQDPLRIEFMAAAAALSGSACEIVTLEAAGSAVAALVLFRDGETRRFYTVYFDPAWARFSPGIALIYEVTRRSLSEGLDCDYMTGEQPHKMRFATSQVPLFRVQATADQVAQVLTEAPRSPLAA